MNFSVSIRQSDDVSIVEMKGHLTSFELGAMREAIQGLLKQGRTNILLNLSGLQYLDSSGVGELVRNYMSVVKRGGTMKVVGLGPKVEEILKITQLHQVFQEFPDERSAMESFPTSGSSRRI
ncbi:MAG TPA: STAS domain-containing protein [Candidatus Dormibacteraeota bacterium]|nr:STAS domain-containing protein [Candidatus Dormibacteraeota bacterium]